MEVTQQETKGRIYIDLDGEWQVEQGDETRSLREILKERRLERGMSQSGLETMAGVGHPSYLQFENGINKSIKVLPDILDALGFDLVILSKVTAGG